MAYDWHSDSIASYALAMRLKALAFVTRVDDSKFSIEWRRGEVTPGGAVVVEVVE